MIDNQLDRPSQPASHCTMQTFASPCYLLSWKYYGLDLTVVVHCMMCGMHKNVPHVHFVISCGQMLRNKQSNERRTTTTTTRKKEMNVMLANAFGQTANRLCCFAFILLLQNMSHNINIYVGQNVGSLFFERTFSNVSLCMLTLWHVQS